MDKLATAPRGQNLAPLVASSCQVLLSDIEVMADIGALESERGVPQPLRIDVRVSVVPPSRDELSHTFDYSRIRAFALELAAERTVLIERFALKLALRCLADDTALEAEVRIGKPCALPGCLAGTRVVVSKCRGVISA